MDKLPGQRNSSQKKEQDKVMARDLTKTGISNMPDGEFKAANTRILARHEKRMEDFREALTTVIKVKNQKLKGCLGGSVG